MYIYLCITRVHTGIYVYITSIHAACGDGKRCLRGSQPVAAFKGRLALLLQWPV